MLSQSGMSVFNHTKTKQRKPKFESLTTHGLEPKEQLVNANNASNQDTTNHNNFNTFSMRENLSFGHQNDKILALKNELSVVKSRLLQKEDQLG